jgi:uncharacterized iron-regulated protein
VVDDRPGLGSDRLRHPFDYPSAMETACTRSVFALVPVLLLQGCASGPAVEARVETARRELPETARSLPIHDGHDGLAMTWEDAVARMTAADVVLIGERHNDGLAHAIQLAVLEAMIADEPATAISLEMLERDEQWIADDYLDDIIDADKLATLTHSTSWSGAGSWVAWYQPLIDAVKEADGVVVAANAPRRYVRLARTDGYERLAEIPAPRAMLFEQPIDLDTGTYRERFDEVMTPPGKEVETETLDATFRAQMLWDATMADSIAKALQAGSPRVVHVVGQFHVEFDGGTVIELRRRQPDARIVTVTVESESNTMRDEDIGRADILVFSGAASE